jgi:hypothetical protein
MIEITIKVSGCPCCENEKSPTSPETNGAEKDKQMGKELMDVFRSVLYRKDTNLPKPEKD